MTRTVAARATTPRTLGTVMMMVVIIIVVIVSRGSWLGANLVADTRQRTLGKNILDCNRMPAKDR
ncbi:MAG TPA: hypothetical protein DCY79_22410 [Planctomycetaceae bacterium]|nr:hypothetical protein [Blastopirellula sp.]HAY82570.1 hypothetical protein [Planctomycetaceae bacterium]